MADRILELTLSVSPRAVASHSASIDNSYRDRALVMQASVELPIAIFGVASPGLEPNDFGLVCWRSLQRQLDPVGDLLRRQEVCCAWSIADGKSSSRSITRRRAQ